MSNKTEQPTQRRLAEARKKGQVPRSPAFVAAGALSGGLWAFCSQTVPQTQRLRTWTVELLSGTQQDPVQAIGDAVGILSALAAPPLLASAVGALVASLLTTGPMLCWGQVAPDLVRVDPFRGASRLASSAHLARLGQGLAMLVAVTVVGWMEVREGLGEVVRAGASGGTGALALSAAVSLEVLTAGTVALLMLGACHSLWARLSHRRSLMMTRDERRREHRDSEGDPLHKAHRQALHRKLALAGRARGTQVATAVVVNPTHIAVALRYAPDECEVPYLVAKGMAEDALAIRREAASLGIPIIKDIPLARSLIHHDVGDAIPEELYRAAAAVLKTAQALETHPEEIR